REVLAAPGLFVIAVYMWVWLRFRPSVFVVHADALEILWPLKRRRILCTDIVSVRLMNRRELRDTVGFGMRVGAGGLWGGFGWVWTTRRGIVQMYVPRTDGFVWIERKSNRPWMITPERPEEFVRTLSTRTFGVVVLSLFLSGSAVAQSAPAADDPIRTLVA